MCDVQMNTALHLGAQEGHVEVMRLLLANGAEVNQPRREGNRITTKVHTITEDGRVEVTEEPMLLEKGADAVQMRTDYSCTPVIVAAQNGHVEVVRVLLEHGAKVNSARSNGGTALMVAAEKGHPETVRLLLEKGAAQNRVTHNGDTALLIATHNGHEQVVRVLLEGGAAANQASTISLLGSPAGTVRVFDRNLHSKVPLVPTHRFNRTLEALACV
jgi:serine/threonine-protein phosphatase 6 regulatory ankyrin repeat subunit B